MTKNDFLKLSVKYWKRHKKRLLTLMAVTMIGAAVLCMMALFIHSDKTIVLNREPDLLGNCLRSENEIAIDNNTAKERRVVPISGQRLQLTLFDLEKKERYDRL